MTEHIYLARQAILDNHDMIMGYELLYRESEDDSHIDNPRHATAAVLVNVLNQAGLKNVVGDNIAFINVESSFLKHDFIESIPPETFVFELTATGTIDERTIECVQQLHAKGYSFSLDLDSYKKMSILKELSPYLSCVKVDTSSFEKEFISVFLREFRNKRLTFIASKVENKEMFNLYKKAGFNAYQGYYFAQPDIIKDKKLDGNHLTLFRLCNTIQTGASISEIVEEFERNPSIMLQLLQFINSGAFHFRSRISSIHQVITLLGRNALVQWLMLLLYSKNFSNETRFQNPLIIMVKQRTEIMVDLLKVINKDVSVTQSSQAYFVGILSLMDTLMHVPLSDVVCEFNVDDTINDALFHKTGLLGELYSVAVAIEEFDTNVIDNFLFRHKIEAKDFEALMLKVFKSATNLERSVDLV
ncbi:EAL domain-containing protein [Sulfurimonas sp. MAG313]|nr:EAL domain-containing protein [Sulfurimonas sp. MAG313]MDF1881667.1 EAL domain-containing protein [Sulfurimonas sp. MAG313]